MEIEREKNEYEISFLINSAENESEVIEILNANQAEIFNKSQISELRLAYPIKKRKSAFFGYYQFVVLPEVVKQIDAALKLKPNVLRFLLVRPVSKGMPTKPAPQSKPTKIVEPEISKPKAETLSNELLEKKLEEILK